MPTSLTIESPSFSDQFVISCGTVTLDLQLGKALLIRWNKNGEIMLPKGRKNIGESLYDAALRETLEETGYKATSLPLPVATLSTPKTDTDDGLPHTEPIAVNQRFSPKKQLKIIFWFAAQADSTQPRQMGSQQEDEDFEPLWTPVGEVDQTLTFDEDRQIAQKVIDGARHLINE
ncbi:hypothetical protein AAF712_006805 [Marasmius tenuissimus]|uniref:Nudix hydrolase domain-containing protein n=1 Tax=Marasmius tenuissimus TaxID=585030 RepID=A0ABR2ZWZ1_9AGAR|nr:hypothetical protein PM082_017638 [Marasmius tenuissimus]